MKSQIGARVCFVCHHGATRGTGPLILKKEYIKGNGARREGETGNHRFVWRKGEGVDFGVALFYSRPATGKVFLLFSYQLVPGRVIISQ